MTTLAKQNRQKNALRRFRRFKREDFWPRTNRPRFESDEHFGTYLVRKAREERSLIAATINA